MEVIEIGGYTEEEKVQIARCHLLPKQIEVHGLEDGFLEVPDRMLRAIIRTHTREAGVRELERKLATICRKAARRVVQGRATRVRISPHTLEEFLGPARYRATWRAGTTDRGGDGPGGTEHGGECCPWRLPPCRSRRLTITGGWATLCRSRRGLLSPLRVAGQPPAIDLEKLERPTCTSTCRRALSQDGPLR